MKGIDKSNSGVSSSPLPSGEGWGGAVISLFSGVGGMDLGFRKAGFEIVAANEIDTHTLPTYHANFPEVRLIEKDIREVDASELPDDVVGIIGGPPCQSWSKAGRRRGIEDERGQLFYEYIRILKAKQPLFFIAENVKGMMSQPHSEAVKEIVEEFENVGYNVAVKVLDANDYGVPQKRMRCFYVGMRKDMGVTFRFPDPLEYKPTMRDAIFDLQDSAMPGLEPPKNRTNGRECVFPNHEYFVDGFSPVYMSGNRVHSWDEPAFCVQASGRQTQLHPQAPRMVAVDMKPQLRGGLNKWIFVPGKEHLYRRLTVRECARLQTFPDTFRFAYKDLLYGYKMVGNAVPVEMAYQLALQVKKMVMVYGEKR